MYDKVQGTSLLLDYICISVSSLASESFSLTLNQSEQEPPERLPRGLHCIFPQICRSCSS